MDEIQSSGVATVRVRNVGGIESNEVEFRPGVTVLEGRNATNRTSLLQALAAALGSDQASLKADAEEGEVRLELDGETYTRTFERTGDGVRTGGDPYLDDPEEADLFSVLLESNAARRAVERGDDLRELIMRPVDTDAIRADIDRLEATKRDLDDDLSELEDLADRLPQLEERRTSLREELDEKRERRRRLEADAESTDDADGDLEERITTLNDCRSDLESVLDRLSSQEESLAALREERADLEAKLDDCGPVPDEELDRIDRQLSDLRDRKSRVESTVNRLDRIVGFNEDVLDGSGPPELLGDSDGEGDPTDRLLEDSVVCWTCGAETEQSAIASTLDRLRDLRADHVEERSEVAERIDELTEQRTELEGRRDQRDQLQDRLDRVRSEIDDRESAVASARERRDELEDRIEDLEAEIADLREEDTGDDHRRDLARLEFEIDGLESDLAEVESEIERVEGRLEERESLSQRREEVRSELRDLRTRIDQLESDAVERFNEHMANLLSALEYDNVERIWIEPTEASVRDGRGTATERRFDLHVVRSTPDGTVYEDQVDHLSESEREVVGLVVALAGNLAHGVHQRVPFILLDSLEAIDADRIAAVVEYFDEYADFLVVALLPEDAEPVESDHTITHG